MPTLLATSSTPHRGNGHQFDWTVVFGPEEGYPEGKWSLIPEHLREKEQVLLLSRA